MLNSILKFRPLVAFDETNPEHRKHYWNFVNDRSWGNCPVRFVIQDESSDLVSYINRKMLDYYLKNEFKRKPISRRKRLAK